MWQCVCWVDGGTGIWKRGRHEVDEVDDNNMGIFF